MYNNASNIGVNCEILRVFKWWWNILLAKINVPLCSFGLFSWCSCSPCDLRAKLNKVAFKFIIAKHNHPCSCTCPFCDTDCQTLKRLSPCYIMEHLLCPPSRQFPLSSVYSCDCIFNATFFNVFNSVGVNIQNVTLSAHVIGLFVSIVT